MRVVFVWFGILIASASLARKACSPDERSDIRGGVGMVPDLAALIRATNEYNFAISRRAAPEVCYQLPALLFRGRREDRVQAAPAVSCAIAHKERAHEHTGSAETLRPSLRNGFTAYFELSPVNGSFATVAGGIPPAHLTPAPRRQDHTTSPYAPSAYVSRLSRPSHLTARS